ncbi:hypothetical protein ACOI1H_17655 [Loktanella sp. DJP18]|uniref:hypothetical protein n=1 Tax=Loktanella sp. DJP18 TaxID=3409788 RepID=UPI003BB6135F
MGVEAYHAPTPQDLAGAVASWEAEKEPRNGNAVLDDRPWVSAPREVVTTLDDTQRSSNHPSDLVQDLDGSVNPDGPDCGCTAWVEPVRVIHDRSDRYGYLPEASAGDYISPAYNDVTAVPAIESIYGGYRPTEPSGWYGASRR